MSQLTIAIIQSDLHWEDVDANLAMFEEQIWSIDQAVDLILLPESFNSGFSMNVKKLAEVPGLKTQKWLLQMASQQKAIVGGSYTVNDKGKLYNRFLAAMPDGTYYTYDKRHLFSPSDEGIFLNKGSKKLIIAYKGWKICPLICYDLRFPVWSKNRFDATNQLYDYDLLLYVASWPAKRNHVWETLLKARAIENHSYVAGANRVGTDGNDFEYIGNSTVIDFLGNPLNVLHNQIGIIIHTIHKADLDDARAKFPFLADGDRFSVLG